METDAQTLVRRQRAFFETGQTLPIPWRREQLNKLGRAMASHEGTLFDALHADLRKSPAQAFVSEIGPVLAEIRHAAAHLPRWTKPQHGRVPLLAWPARAKVEPVPRGLSLILSPWNYPVQLLLLPLVGSIAAGNCAVLKPSERAPRTGEALARMIRDTFAEEFVATLSGDDRAAGALLEQRFDSIFFTGGARVGREVMAAAARHLTPVVLELGGKCPAIVCADAPLRKAARRIAWGKFMNAGQTCVAPDYVLADRRVRAALVDELKAALREFYGPDASRSPDYGRIIDRRHFDRLVGYLGEGRIASGGTHDADDLYLAPTVLTDVPSDARVMSDEVFGPILPVLDFERIGDALAFVKERPAPLAVYLFTNDAPTRDRIVAGTRSGGVCVNDVVVQSFGPALPFGGLDESGMGRYHGRASFDFFSHPRTIVKRGLVPDVRLRNPPVTTPLRTLRRAYRFLMG